MKKRNSSAPYTDPSDLHAPMQTPVPVASTSTPAVMLICTRCATPRPGHPYETHHNVGGQTHAHCRHCSDVKPHRVTRPGDPPPKAKRASSRSPRKSRSTSTAVKARSTKRTTRKR